MPWASGADVSKQDVIDAVVRRGERLPFPSGCNRWGFKVRTKSNLDSMYAIAKTLEVNIRSCIQLPGVNAPDCRCLADLVSSMWASNPIERPSARLVVAELERIGLLWDLSGQQFSQVAKVRRTSTLCSRGCIWMLAHVSSALTHSM